MGNNTFGKIFTITTWGESHGPCIGVVVDGAPAGLDVSEDDINIALKKRAPGKTPFTSARVEPDEAQIMSGVFDGKTTGASISIIIQNKDADSSKYESLKDKLRPGHADFTYMKKYKNVDYRGGGRASARETAARVAASVIANKILQKHSIEVHAYLQQVGDIAIDYPYEKYQQATDDAIFCPDHEISLKMQKKIIATKEDGDSIGGVVAFYCKNLPIGLGEPIYQKLEAQLAAAMLCIPASKGFEIGQGFKAAQLHGSEHNDNFIMDDKGISFASNNSGGILGGITTGEPIYGKVAFKPASSIMRTQETVTKDGKQETITLPKGSRHDPCVAIRAVPVVEAMCCIVLADALLQAKSNIL